MFKDYIKICDYIGVSSILKNDSFVNIHYTKPNVTRAITQALPCLEGSDHVRIRKHFSSIFSKQSIANITEDISNFCQSLLSNKQKIEIVKDYALPIVVRYSFSIFGIKITQSRIPYLVKQLELNLVPDDESGYQQSQKCLNELFIEVANIVYLNRNNEILSQLLFNKSNEQEIEYQEVITNIMLILAAGLETTVNAIAGGIIEIVLNSKEEEARSDLIISDEILRYISPIKNVLKKSIIEQEIVVESKTIKVSKGDIVLLDLAKANRDSSVFSDPNLFDFNRINSHAHLAFGKGMHYCIGSNLGKIEIESSIKAFFRNYKNIKIIDNNKDNYSGMLNIYEKVELVCDII